MQEIKIIIHCGKEEGISILLCGTSVLNTVIKDDKDRAMHKRATSEITKTRMSFFAAFSLKRALNPFLSEIKCHRRAREGRE